MNQDGQLRMSWRTLSANCKISRERRRLRSRSRNVGLGRRSPRGFNRCSSYSHQGTQDIRTSRSPMVESSSCLGTICCVCERRPSSTQRPCGLGLVEQLCCRRWYTYSVGRRWTTCDACSPSPNGSESTCLRRRDQLLASGHCCQQRRLCKQLP